MGGSDRPGARPPRPGGEVPKATPERDAGHEDEGPGEAGRGDPDRSEPEKARTEIAAGDVADDLADFA